MAGVEEESEVVKDMFELIHKYQVPTPPEDLAVYQVYTYMSCTLHRQAASCLCTHNKIIHCVLYA